MSLKYQNRRLLIDFLNKALKDPIELNSLFKSNQLDSVILSLLKSENELDIQLARSIAERIL